MRKTPILLLFAFLFYNSFISHATTYYVKATGGSNTSGLSDVNAWNYATLNSKRLSPGDTVLLKRGDTFFGELQPQAGTASKWIYYGAYGNGANPVITGFATITNWVKSSGSVYYADLSAYKLSTVNLVTLDGSVEGMGRYPNRGYLTYTRHTTNTSITGADISSLPFNASGGEAVIRKVRWILDRQPITTQSGSTLTLGTTSLYGGALSYEAVDKNGFFIQNHLRTLDKEGEWYYDIAAKRLYMVLTGNTGTVKVSVLEQLIYLSSKSYISFADIDFTGSNTHGISMHGATNIAFTRCRFDQHGQTAIYGNSVSNITISGGSISNCLNNGIWVEWGGNNIKVDGVAVSNIGTIAGAGRSGDGAQQGIAVSGTNTTITNCTVTNIGYNGIQFNGSNAKIENNLIDQFCLVKDDGGGIYTYEESGVTVANRVVRNNIVLNAVGTFAGAESYYYEAHGKAAGVYLDGNSNHTEVSNNVIAHGEWAGVFVNNNSGNQILSNLIFNHAESIYLLESQAGNVRNMTITGNECVAKTATQKALYIKLYAADNPASMGTFNNNFYARPVDDSKTITLDKQYTSNGTTELTLAEWKATYGVDVLSGKSAIDVDNEDKIRFDYNYSPTAKVIALTGTWKDIYSTLYQSSYTIPSYKGKVFLSAIGSTGAPTLPLKDNSFTATLTGSTVTLNWVGYSDAASHYELERSADGAAFSQIGVVDGRSASKEAAYTYVDQQPLSPVNYYRLKVVENNGSVDYSKVLKVNVTRPGSSFQAFPNPVATSLTIRFPEPQKNVDMRIADMSGRMVKEAQLGAGQSLQVDVSRLVKGVYVLMVNGESMLFSKL
jgi:hypothetical protein